MFTKLFDVKASLYYNASFMYCQNPSFLDLLGGFVVGFGHMI